MPSKSASEFKNAFDKACSLAARKEHSKAELSCKLLSRGFSEEAVAYALDKAERYGFIDEERYAESMIRSNLMRGCGADAIKRQLSGLSLEDPEALFADALPTEEEEKKRALELLRKHPPRSKNPLQSAYRKLVSKGYGCALASEVAHLWFGECKAENP